MLTIKPSYNQMKYASINSGRDFIPLYFWAATSKEGIKKESGGGD